jgi:hypothetical protein
VYGEGARRRGLKQEGGGKVRVPTLSELYAGYSPLSISFSLSLREIRKRGRKWWYPLKCPFSA